MVEPEIVEKFRSLFENKRWNQNIGYEYSLNNLLVLLEHFTEGQQQLIFELLDRYVWIPGKEYDSNILTLLKKMDLIDRLEHVEKVFLIPIQKKSDMGKTKSGHNVLYTLRSLKPILSSYENIKFVERKIDSLIDINDKQVVFLVDDFIGSGNTLEESLKTLRSINDFDEKNINILTIAIQSETYEKLAETKIGVFSNKILKKGISDYYTPTVRPLKVKLMEEIEKYIISKKFSFGYEKSEMLLTLLRTPNNTFPIFWDKCKIKNKPYKTPFSRN